MDVSLGQTFPSFKNLVTPIVGWLGSFPQLWHLLHSQDFSGTFEKDPLDISMPISIGAEFGIFVIFNTLLL